MKNNFATYYSSEGSLIWGGFFSSGGDEMEKGGNIDWDAMPEIREAKARQLAHELRLQKMYDRPDKPSYQVVGEYETRDGAETISGEDGAVRETSGGKWQVIRRMAGGGTADDFAGSEKSPIFVSTKITREDVNQTITGTCSVTRGDSIQATSNFLRRSKSAGASRGSSYFFKGQDEERLREYISENNLWIPLPNPENKFAEGGEAKVYLYGDYVVKINDAFFYGSWEDYLNSLLIHNLFFPRTSYELIGFSEYKDFDERILYAVVKQAFIKETRDGKLFFIDTVFYLEDTMSGGGKAGIPERYKNMGFSKVGQKKKSTRPKKKWMVLAKKGDKYKVVHGGYKGMKDFSQHHDSGRRKRFWKRMGGEDSDKAKDPFSPLYWHRRLGTWGEGGMLEDGTVKVAWIDSDTPDIMESKMYDDLGEALKESEGKVFMIMELERSDGDYYKWKMLPYGMYDKFQKVLDWSGIFSS